MFLLDLLLSLAIATFLLMSQISNTQRTVETSRGVATAQYMVQLQSAVNSCINQGLIDGSTPVANYWTIMTTNNCLSTGVSQTSPLGLKFSFTLSPALCKADTCVGHAYATTPLTDFAGKPRTDILGKVISTIGVDGGMSYAGNGAQLIGYGNSYQDVNPAGNVPGTVSIRIGANSGLLSLLTQYYRLDGTRKLTGDMDANQKNIKNVDNLTLNTLNFDQVKGVGTPGAACAKDKALAQNTNGNGLVICNGGVFQRIGDATSGIGGGNACSLKGLTGTDAVGTGYICNGTFWVENKNFAASGDACAITGQTAQNTVTGEELVCRNTGGSNRYVKLTNLLAKSIEIARYIVQDGTLVSKPTCDVGGTATFSIDMMQSVVDVAMIPPRQTMYQKAIDNGSTWTVRIRLTDNFGGDFSANPYNVQAIFKTECTY